MTGFAAATGENDGWTWAWDIRAVNARGLDIRLRVPDWVEGLEAAVKPVVQKAVGRGNVNLSLKIARDAERRNTVIDVAALDLALELVSTIEDAAQAKGVALTPATSADVLNMRGVLDTTGGPQDTVGLLEALMAQLPELVSAFNDMRLAEGTALHNVLERQFNEIETLTEAAAELAAQRGEQMRDSLRKNLARVLDNSDGVDADRVAQELAMIAVKTDVTEEIDRLHAHVKAARDLLALDEPIGRKLDFLSQEFNREANTLCSKAQSPELTKVGLDLKAVIDQMREQVQNVE